MDTARRRALNASVAALCIEAGYLSSDRGAIELLTQILQSYICEIGRTSRAYSDSAHRSDPSVCDIELALIDLGTQPSLSLSLCIIEAMYIQGPNIPNWMITHGGPIGGTYHDVRPLELLYN
jgi:histone H3/H4